MFVDKQNWSRLQLSPLTNANRQHNHLLTTVHSAHIRPALSLLVTPEYEKCSLTTISTILIHSISTGRRHRSTLWVVPHYSSGRWFCGMQAKHWLCFPNSHRHIWQRGIQLSVAIPEVRCRHYSGRNWGRKGTAMTEGRGAIRRGLSRCVSGPKFSPPTSYLKYLWWLTVTLVESSL